MYGKNKINGGEWSQFLPQINQWASLRLIREVNDYYATHPDTIPPLFEKVSFSDTIWECACGEGHLSVKMTEMGKKCIAVI